jgi:hypothetical protein
MTMAIALEFIDFVIPIATIRAKYPGGWEQCLSDHDLLLGGRVWHDSHLFRDGAMNPRDIEALVEEWTDRGFQAIGIENGRRVWKDVCVIESLFQGPTLPCDWLEVDAAKRIAFLKGSAPGEVVGRNNFKRSDT